MLGPAALTSSLVDLGAEVIKVEPPQGDYVRDMTWPIVEGVSLMHLHVNRGKRSLVLDLRKPEAVEVYLDLVRVADAVIEAMRPGGLERRGLGYERLKEVNPRIVFITISGYGMTGPYADLASHGIAFDTWAGVVPMSNAIDEEGFYYIPEHASIGIHTGPLFGALGVLAGIIQARTTGTGCRMEIAQSDAAAAIDWLRTETYKAHERPESEVTGNKSDNYVRREPGTAGMKGGVRYSIYEAADGLVMFMASEQEFWKNFCQGVGRMDLFEKWPGSKYADHAKGNREMQAELRDIFKTKTMQEWIEFSKKVNTAIAPVHTAQTLMEDPQFKDRFEWIPKERVGCDQLPTPIKMIGEELPMPEKAPDVGQHSEAVLRDVLGYDDTKLKVLREAGALGAS